MTLIEALIKCEAEHAWRRLHALVLMSEPTISQIDQDRIRILHACLPDDEEVDIDELWHSEHFSKLIDIKVVPGQRTTSPELDPAAKAIAVVYLKEIEAELRRRLQSGKWQAFDGDNKMLAPELWRRLEIDYQRNSVSDPENAPKIGVQELSNAARCWIYSNISIDEKNLSKNSETAVQALLKKEKRTRGNPGKGIDRYVAAFFDLVDKRTVSAASIDVCRTLVKDPALQQQGKGVPDPETVQRAIKKHPTYAEYLASGKIIDSVPSSKGDGNRGKKDRIKDRKK